MSLSIIIPSKNLSNLQACIRALRTHGDESQVIVIWDGGIWAKSWARENNVGFLRGVQPFIFARNCNQGIRASDGDVLLLNDDALLRTHDGFTRLAQLWETNRQYGLIGATMTQSGTPEQINQPGFALREVPSVVTFACVFIPRRTIDAVGLLDERFAVNAGGPGARGYGLEDDDYCHRVRLNGMKCGVWDGCLVDHGSIKSTFRDDPEHPWDVVAHEKLFREKWGINPPGHGYPK